MGTFVRERYSNLIGSEFKPEDTYIMSTGSQRTMESAKAQLNGLYGKPFRFPSVEQFPIVEVPHSENFLSHVDIHNCPRFAQLQKRALEDPENQAMEKKMAAFWNHKFYPSLR